MKLSKGNRTILFQYFIQNCTPHVSWSFSSRKLQCLRPQRLRKISTYIKNILGFHYWHVDTTFAEGPRRFEEKVQNRAALLHRYVRIIQHISICFLAMQNSLSINRCKCKNKRWNVQVFTPYSNVTRIFLSICYENRCLIVLKIVFQFCITVVK